MSDKPEKFPVGWIPCINAESEACPPFAVVEAKGFDDTLGLLRIGKPSSDGSAAVFFNGPTPIPPHVTSDTESRDWTAGQVHQTFPAIAAYQADNTDGEDPAHDEEWGTQSGSWYLHRGELGFRIIGPGLYGVCNVIRENPTEGPPGGVPGGVPVADMATTGPLPSCTYSNGASGVGATLTASANGSLTVDGEAASLGKLILVKDQVTIPTGSRVNGLYEVTQAGTGSLPWILTRHTANDESSEFANVVVYAVRSGTINAGSMWTYTGLAAPVMGTSDIPIQAALRINSLNGAPPAINLNVRVQSINAHVDTGIWLGADYTASPAAGHIYLVAASPSQMGALTAAEQKLGGNKILIGNHLYFTNDSSFTVASASTKAHDRIGFGAMYKQNASNQWGEVYADETMVRLRTGGLYVMQARLEMELAIGGYVASDTPVWRLYGDTTAFQIETSTTRLTGLWGSVAGIEFSGGIVTNIPTDLAYSATTPGDWSGSAPTTIKAAIDRCAALLKTLNGGTGP